MASLVPMGFGAKNGAKMGYPEPFVWERFRAALSRFFFWGGSMGAVCVEVG